MSTLQRRYKGDFPSPLYKPPDRFACIPSGCGRQICKVQIADVICVLGTYTPRLRIVQGGVAPP